VKKYQGQDIKIVETAYERKIVPLLKKALSHDLSPKNI
jgi:hypothetical protein